MTSLSIKYYLYALMTVLLQGLVIQNIDLGMIAGHKVDILIYPILLILLPVRTSTFMLVVWAFFCGLGIDIFYNSPGVHTSALVFTAYIRHYIMYRFEPRTGFAPGALPIQFNPSSNYYLFVAIVLFIHIFVYYVMSYFNLALIGEILSKTVISFLFSYLLLFIHGYILRALTNT